MPVEKIFASAVCRFRNSLISQNQPAAEGNDLFLQRRDLLLLFRTQILAMFASDLAIVFRRPRQECGEIEFWNFVSDFQWCAIFLNVALVAVLRPRYSSELGKTIPAGEIQVAQFGKLSRL